MTGGPVGAEAFVGSWRLASSETHWDDGSVSQPWGPSPVGLLVYDPGGLMSVQVMRPGRAAGVARPPVPAAVLGTVGESEILGYLAYAGTYRVDTAARRVVHHVTCALLPEQVGQDIAREYDLAGDTLTLRTPPAVVSGRQRRSVLVWRRARPAGAP